MKQNVYLAVDFFFVLSGFVIGYAYDDRWDKMTTWSFFKRRLVGLLFFFGEQAFRGIADAPAWKIAVCFIPGWQKAILSTVLSGH